MQPVVLLSSGSGVSLGRSPFNRVWDVFEDRPDAKCVLVKIMSSFLHRPSMGETSATQPMLVPHSTKRIVKDEERKAASIFNASLEGTWGACPAVPGWWKRSVVLNGQLGMPGLK